MAYVLPQDDEEQKQQQAQQQTTPMLGGAQSFGGASGNGGQAPAETPKSQNAQSKGSGFTNLSNWLDAGKGRDQSITSKSTGLLGTEKDTFNKALEPVKSADFKAKNVVDAGTADPAKGNLGINQFENTFNSAAGGDANAKTEVTGMLNQKYDGPRDVNYDATKQKNLWDTASLTSADTAGQVLARPQIEAGQYGAGMQRLDSALFGADSASRGAMDTAKKDLTSFGDTVKTDTKAMMDKVAGFDAAAKSGNESTKAALEKIGANMSGAIDSRVAEARAKEEEARKALADGYIQTEDGYRKAGNGYSAGAITGGGATRDNIATAQERSGFDLLNELIGADKLQQAGPYQGVKAETNFDANWKPDNGRGTYDARPFTAMDMLSDSNPEHAKILRDAWQEYGPKNDNGTYHDGMWKEFYDRFQREHPEVKLPSGEEADAYENEMNVGVEEARKTNPFYTDADYKRDHKRGGYSSKEATAAAEKKKQEDDQRRAERDKKKKLIDYD